MPSSRGQSPSRQYGYFMGGNPPPAPKEDKRSDKVAVFATRCLGCFCEEGAFHATDCVFRQDTGGALAEEPVKALQLDLKYLIRTYGLEPRYATLDDLGTLTIFGPSKER